MSQVTNDLPVIPPNVVRLILNHRRQRLAAEAEANQKTVAGHKVSQAPTSNGDPTPFAHANGAMKDIPR